jgi:hypothetical protein
MGRKPGLPAGPIQPFHLACACYLYESMTGYAKSLALLQRSVGEALDLSQEGHRLALLKFLNDWGVRGLAKDWHWLASEALESWHDEARDSLPLPDDSPNDLDAARLRDLAQAFDSLSKRTAAKRRTKNGKQSSVSFGPTASSKCFFALRPHLLPAWDDQMRTAFEHDDGTGVSYVEFMKDIHRKIEETEQDWASRGLSLTEFPAKLERPPFTTVAQLMVEYYWITVTRGVALPSRTTIGEWLSW